MIDEKIRIRLQAYDHRVLDRLHRLAILEGLCLFDVRGETEPDLHGITVKCLYVTLRIQDRPCPKAALARRFADRVPLPTQFYQLLRHLADVRRDERLRRALGSGAWC